MKRTLFISSMFITVPVLALTLDEAKQEVARAQANLDAAHKRVEDLKSRVETGQQHAESIAGKVEKNVEMERQKETTRQTIDEHNKAVDSCRAKLEDLQKVVSRVGKEHTIVSSRGKFEVTEQEQPEPKPITRTAPEGARQPYASNGSTYELAP